MSRRVLVLSAAVGAGHLRAAQAVELGMLAPDATVKNVDVLELTNATFRRLYGQAYLNNIGTLPHKLNQLLGNPERIAALKRNARRLGKPQAAFEVARRALAAAPAASPAGG